MSVVVTADKCVMRRTTDCAQLVNSTRRINSSYDIIWACLMGPCTEPLHSAVNKSSTPSILCHNKPTTTTVIIYYYIMFGLLGRRMALSCIYKRIQFASSQSECAGKSRIIFHQQINHREYSPSL